MIKAIFFDIDGTLLSHTAGRVPESTRAALSQLKQRGVKLFIASGRHRKEVDRLLGSGLSFDGYITLNGQICLDAGGGLVHDNPIPERDTGVMAMVFEKKEIPVMIIEQDRMYINFVNQAVRTAQEAVSTPVPEISGYTGGRVYQFIVYGTADTAAPLAAQLPGCKMSRWNPYAVDIIPRDGGKTAGIRKFLQHWGISREETMAFGDGENDMEMLRFAGIGVAMGNADRAVKDQADYVTSDVDQDGVAKALELYGLL